MSGKQLQQFDVLWPDLADRQEEAGRYNNSNNYQETFYNYYSVLEQIDRRLKAPSSKLYLKLKQEL